MKKFLVFLSVICLAILVASANCQAILQQYDVFAHDVSMKLYTEEIEKNPGNAKLYCDRAGAYTFRKEFDKAIADYAKAMEIDPNFHGAYAGCGKTYIYMGELAQNRQDAKTAYEKAVVYLNRAIKISPQNEEAYYQRGYAYQMLAKCAQEFVEAKKAYDQAIADYSKSIALNRKYEKSYSLRAEIYLETGEYAKAIADYTYILEAFGFAMDKLGDAYVLTGDYGKALDVYSKVTMQGAGVKSISLKTLKVYTERGKIYLRLGKYDEAIADFTQTVNIATDIIETPERIARHSAEYEKKCAEAHYLRACAYYEKGQYDKGFSDCARALELSPDHTDAQILKGTLFKALSKS